MCLHIQSRRFTNDIQKNLIGPLNEIRESYLPKEG